METSGVTHAEYVKRVQRQKRTLMRLVKSHRGCARCGETDPSALDMHHLADKDTRLTKYMSSGRVVTGGGAWVNLSFSELVVEIGKCEVLCANCHRKVSGEKLGWGESLRFEILGVKALEAARELGVPITDEQIRESRTRASKLKSKPAANKGKKWSASQREKQMAIRATPEHHKKLSEAQTRRWAKSEEER